ncbi:MAG: cytochrome c1 [Gammaproteobacteria bacterium]|nr:cytochrome c1 [Gammaproteobacteria bacterium]
MMKRYILTILLAFSSSQLIAEEKFEGLQLASAPINYTDMASIKRGATFFATNCMSCHTLSYLRYDKVAKEAGIDPNQKPISLNGVIPPDLSLEADVRGVDWIYTYLHSFYKDPATPSGVNNLVFPGTAMPAILSPYQGEQVLVEKPVRDLFGYLQWYDLVVPTKQGTMTPEQFDTVTADLVNFLAYAAAPYRAEQERLGYWVLGFLVILFVLMYLLKKEYWKDVETHRKK